MSVEVEVKQINLTVKSSIVHGVNSLQSTWMLCSVKGVSPGLDVTGEALSLVLGVVFLHLFSLIFFT